MDFSELETKKASDEGVVLIIKNPTNGKDLVDKEGKTSTLTLLGPDSDVWRKYEHQRSNKLAKERQVSRDFDIDPHELSLGLAVEVTKSWQNVSYQGQELPCTPENVRMIYNKCGWLLAQVNAFIGDRVNFLKS